MTHSIGVAILSGGPSAERDVSRVSAAAVEAALKAIPRFDVHALELGSGTASALMNLKPDVVLPILHGPPGEDGTLQGLLELLALPYVGSAVAASALAMDKLAAKGVFQAVGLPTAAFEAIHARIDTPHLSAKLAGVKARLGERLVVKPLNQGSALGVTRTETFEELEPAVQTALDYGGAILIEERIDGREMTVGVLDVDGECLAFPVIEITIPDQTWYDFNHRYTQGASAHLMPAPIDEDLRAQLQHAAVLAHQALGCRDLSRVDFIVKDESFVVLEVNTMPGMTPTSLYPEGAEGAGIPFASLLERLIQSALNRR